MTENVVEGLAEILEAARTARMYKQSTFSAAIPEPVSTEAFAKWNALIAGVTEIGWDFLGGAQLLVLGGTEMSLLSFLHRPDPEPDPEPDPLPAN